ncbi:MAG TPA: thiamine-phosphate kinase [Streptosporangiaceae bacterium]|nr:thiamine-phosphate kinase [Streptosporangiaceae bacterium]
MRSGLREDTISVGDRSIGELGEFGLIAEMAARMRSGPGTIVGIGDDAAVLAAPDGRVVATTDFLLEGRHFRREWAGASDIGHRAAVRSLADIAAMGAVPTALLIAFAAPPSLPAAWALDLAAGLAAESARAGASVAGGDTARSETVLLAVTGLGDLQGRNPVTRSGARPGDVVAVAGPLGRSAAGLAMLRAGIAEPAELVAAHLRPAPPYDAGPEAAALGATAMIDISDGLLADVGHIADASGVLVDIRTASLDVGPLEAAGAAVGMCGEEKEREGGTGRGAPASPGASLDAGPAVHPGAGGAGSALDWVLTGGEDHSLAATFPPGVALPPRWSVVGQVREGRGVLVDGQPYRGVPGWDHFR